MNDQRSIQKKAILYSVTLGCLFFAAITFANILGRWGAFDIAPYLIGLVVWVVWAVHFGWMQMNCVSANGPKGRYVRLVVGIFASVFVVGFAYQCGEIVGKVLRFHDIKIAVDAGLQEDCVKLLLHWPVKGDRINNFDPEFSKLGSGIRIFSPVYVMNDSIDDTNIPPNIGLCKNGFGGFAIGIRVFQNEQDADKFIAYMRTDMKVGKDFEFRRVTSEVYFWWQDT